MHIYDIYINISRFPKMEETRKFAILFVVICLGYNQNFSATAASIPTDDKCASQICPKSGICPTDSFLPQKILGEEWYDLHRGDASLSIDRLKQDLVDYCCTRDRCICNGCPSGPTFQDVLKCKTGQVLLVVKLGNGQPGTCCDQYQCGEKPICGDHKNSIKYYTDECTKCACDNPFCEQLCSVEERREILLCWSEELGEGKMTGTNWTERNGCYQCRCEYGERVCDVPLCMKPNCTNPKKIKGQCCPICTEDDEIKRPLPLFTETPAPSKNDMEKVETTSTSTLAPVVSVIDGISIDQSTPLVATSNENKNSTESIELLITDSINRTEMPELDTNTTTTIASSTTENGRNLESYTEDFERNSSMITYIGIEDDGKIQPSTTATFNIPPEESSSSTENPSTSVNHYRVEIQTKNDEEESKDNENDISDIDTEEQSEDSDNDNSDIPDTDNTDSSHLKDEFDKFEFSISISSSSSSSSVTDDDDGTSSTTSTPMSSSISTSSAVPTPESSLIYKASNTMDRNYRTTEENQNNDTSTNSHNAYIYIGIGILIVIIFIAVIAIKRGKKPKKIIKQVYSKVPGTEQHKSKMTGTFYLFNFLCEGSDKN